MGEGSGLEEARELVADELLDLGFASLLPVGAEFAELLADLVGFEVGTLDFVVEAAALDGGPFNDGGSGSTERITHVRLLKDFFGTGAGAAVGEELFRGKMFALSAIDEAKKAEFDGVGEGDAEIQIPRGR